MTNHPGRSAAAYQSPKPEDIRAFLAERQMTQAALARSVLVSIKTVEQWIAGARSMPAGLWKLAQLKPDQTD